MTVRRCPYCKAIIDIDTQYCSNCGTQILFPEDEEIEEDIPGEKVEEETDSIKRSEPKKRKKSMSKQNGHRKTTKKKKIKNKPSAKKVMDEQKLREEWEQEVEPKKETEVSVDTSEEDKSISEESPSEEEKPEEELKKKKQEQTDAFSEYVKDYPQSEKKKKERGEGEFLEKEQEEQKESLAVKEIPDEGEEGEVEKKLFPDEEEKASSTASENNFDTDDLRKVVDPAEKEKEEIERFLESIKKEKEETREKEELKSKEESQVSGVELPPWAAQMKKSSTSEIREEEEDREKQPEMEIDEKDLKKGGEKEPTVGGTDDTEMGIPETVNQKSLPFTKEEAEGIPFQSSSRISFWIKARALDIVFISSLWFVAVWIASRIISVSVGELIFSSALPLLGFYLILLAVYFFLFLIFLGKTLGDHLFSP